VADLEYLIARYLDGELTLAERDRLRLLLAESPDARALFREMSALSQAARRTPLLHGPPAHLENALFAKLRQEGLHAPALPTASAPVAVAPRWYGGRMLRSVMAGVAVMMAFIGDSYLCKEGAFQLGSPMVKGGSPAYADRGTMAVAPFVAPPAGSPAPVRAAASVARRRFAAAQSAPAGPRQIRQSDTLSPLSPGTPVEDPGLPLASLENTPNVDTMRAPTDNIVIPVEQPIQPMSAETGRSSHFAASFRPGVAIIDRGERTVAREVNVQIGMETAGGHQFSVIVGSAPALTETRRANTYQSLSSSVRAVVPDEGMAPHPESGMELASVDIPAYELKLRSEPWVGVGYSYSIAPVKGMSLGVGVNAGASMSAWRLGGELPVRYAVMKDVSIEAAFSVASYTPRSHDVDQFTITDSPDRFLYAGSSERPSFFSYGVQIGVRVELPGNQ